MTDKLTIRVFGSRIQDMCSSGGWGPSQSQEEITMAIRQLLAKRYGESVGIEYIDVSAPEINDYPEIKKHVDSANTPLPIVAFDDVPAWAGAVSFPHIVQELTRRGIEQK